MITLSMSGKERRGRS